MKIRSLALLAVSALATSGISTVYATQISNSLVGLASPVFTQTFESPAFTQNALINSTFGQISSSTLYYDGNSAGGTGCAFYQESGNCVSNFTSIAGNPNGQNVQPTFSIFFSTPQTSAAFALVAGGLDSDTFTALLNGVSVATFTATTATNYNQGCVGTCAGNFFGFSSIAGGFNQIQVATTGTNLAIIDNVQLSATIPEPGTIALFGLGIGGLVAFRRRRSA